MAYVITVRPQQLGPDGTMLRLYVTNYLLAVRLCGRQVVLYRPRDENNKGYYGTARIIDVEPDWTDPKWIWIELGEQAIFDRPITLQEIHRGKPVSDTVFHTYSRTIRPIADGELAMLSELTGSTEWPGLAERSEGDAFAPAQQAWSSRKQLRRKKHLRDALLREYGPACVFSEKVYRKLNGRFCETQLGHIIALRYGGQDVLQNALPMSGLTNWHWDNGLISLSNAGRILVSSVASADTRALYQEGRMIRFGRPQHWPKAEYLEWHREYIFERGHQEGLRWET